MTGLEENARPPAEVGDVGGKAPASSWLSWLGALLVVGSIAIYIVLNWTAVAVPVRALWRAGGSG